MTLSGNQPYFIPYIGYWQLIKNADVFLIGDDYNYIKRGWVSRNRVLNNGAADYFIVPMFKASDSKNIGEITLLENEESKLLRKVDYLYHKAPYFETGYKIMEDIFTFPDKNLAEFLLHSMQVICDYLEIKTPIIKTSTLEGNSEFKREFRIYDQCERFGADTYVNAIGGMELYDFEEFKKRGIKIKFLKTNEITYKQFNNEFVPNLSILDVIMFNSKEEIMKMLDDYTLVDPEEITE